jgi:hypothetical protein
MLNKSKIDKLSFINYYTNCKYQSPKHLNVELNQSLLDEIMAISYKKKIRLNGTTLKFKSPLVKESVIKYLLKISESNLKLEINETFASLVVEEMLNETPKTVIYKKKSSLFKKDIYNLLKEFKPSPCDIKQVNKYCFIVDNSLVLNYEGKEMSIKGLTLLCHKPVFLTRLKYQKFDFKIINNVVVFPRMNKIVELNLDTFSLEKLKKVKMQLSAYEEKQWLFNDFRRWQERNLYTNELQLFSKRRYLYTFHYYDDLRYLTQLKWNFINRFEIEQAHLFALVVGNFVF